MSATPKPGDTLTAEQANALPVGSVLRDSKSYEYERFEKGWVFVGIGYPWSGGEILCDGHTLVRVGPEPATCPHPEGTWEWAKVQMQAGKCVRAKKWQPKRIIYGVQHFWSLYDEAWRVEGTAHSDSDWSKSTDWRVVPDPSVPAESPVVHIDPTEVCAALDEAIPEWRGAMTVAQAVGKLNLRIGLYQASEADLREKVEALERERDRLRLESMNYEREGMKALEQRDALRTENAELREKAETFKASTIEARIARDSYRETTERMRRERDAALARAEAAEAAIAGLEKERDQLLGRCARAEQRAEAAEARLVVPDDVRSDAAGALKDAELYRSETRALARFILSLCNPASDHLPEAKKMVEPATLESRIAALEARMGALEGKS